MNRLYLCDGNGCASPEESLCYKTGGECVYTRDVDHSLSRKLMDFPPTSFVPSQGGFEVEVLDDKRIFDFLAKGYELKLVKESKE